MIKRLFVWVCVCAGAWAVAVHAAGPTFRPDVVFSGNSLDGWNPIGQADWRAQNGEITGTPKSPDGGFLVLNQSYQDVALFTNVTCTGGCRAGILLRAENTADGGHKGVFVSLAEAEPGSFAVRTDAQGRIVSREPLPTPKPMSFTLPPDVDLPGLQQPRGEYQPGQANSVDITLFDTTVIVRFNGGRLLSGNATAAFEAGSYGPIALYVGGTASASFRNIAYADLTARPFADEKLSPDFRVRRLSEFYYSYSSAIADVNRDGNPDVIAGPYIYYGPAFEIGRFFYTPQSFNPTSEYPMPSMVQLAHDWTGDGWPDILNMSGNAGNGIGTLFVNPQGENRRWDRFVVMQPPDGVVGNEETLLKDIDHDGQPEIIHAGQNTLRYSKPDPANPTGPWKVITISEPGPWGANIGHGMGVGDVDGDGLNDYVTAYGWWKQPPKGQTGLWQYNPVAFARWGASQGGAGGAEMGIYDVNGDGLNDVVTALEGHGFGLAWHEQTRDAQGRISFERHVIMDSYFDKNAGDVWFTQPHATTFADIDGDGILDFLVGKRHHSHFDYMDPDNWGMPVLYVYKVRRNKAAAGGAEFVPELIHNRSGVGSHFATGDLNKDGTIDIATSGPSGTFIFFNLTKPVK